MAKILVVDDSETLRIQLKQALEEAGFEVIEGIHGLAGLDALKNHPDIALIITDVNMPEMDGITMCEKINAHPDWQKIPRFVLTTETGPTMKAQGKAAGVMAWITKPFQSAKVVAAVQKVLASMH